MITLSIPILSANRYIPGILKVWIARTSMIRKILAYGISLRRDKSLKPCFSITSRINFFEYIWLKFTTKIYQCFSIFTDRT